MGRGVGISIPRYSLCLEAIRFISSSTQRVRCFSHNALDSSPPPPAGQCLTPSHAKALDTQSKGSKPARKHVIWSSAKQVSPV